LLGRLQPNKGPADAIGPGAAAGFEHSTGKSVLGALAESIGYMPRVLLRETEPTRPTPVVRPSSGEVPAPETVRQRYKLLGELARGGMGAVLKGRDTDLGRDLGVKVLLDRHRNNSTLITEKDVNHDGVADIIVSRQLGPHHSVTVTYSGLSGKRLSTKRV
jgi:hypothetical protein